MALSASFVLLRTRISELESRFLNFNNADSPLQENQDNLMSFRLLAHAEMEHYLEESARRIINLFSAEWNRNSVILPGLRYLFLYSPTKFEADNYKTINDRIDSCIRSFLSRIDNNHGIKQKNLVLLFAPLGLTQTYFDAAWLATMDSYGARRGSFAHKSYSVQVSASKNDEINDTRLVFAGLRRIDQKLQTLTNTNLRIPY